MHIARLKRILSDDADQHRTQSFLIEALTRHCMLYLEGDVLYRQPHPPGRKTSLIEFKDQFALLESDPPCA